MTCEIRSTFDKYNDDGYVIFKNIINEKLIDNIVVNLEKFKEKNIRFISQSRNKLESSQDVNEHNFLNQSIQHPSKLVRFSPLMKSVSDLISDVSVSNALREITGFERFIRWQDMLFDKSTGTLDHADHWYLDTFPSGYMVAAWFALEDIEKDAGRFFIIPKSHKLALPSYDSLKSHEKYIEIVSKSIEVNSLERYAPDLKKGDVLFWHSKTIHGAFSQKNTKLSRKSVTAHYHPTGFARDKSREVDDVKIILNKLIKTKNPNMYLDNYDPSIINFMYVRYYKEIIKSFVKRGGGTVMSRKDGL